MKKITLAWFATCKLRIQFELPGSYVMSFLINFGPKDRQYMKMSHDRAFSNR